MRRLIPAILFAAAAGCGSGPSNIPPQTDGEEIGTLFGQAFEHGYLRLPERTGAGPHEFEAPVDADFVLSGCTEVCSRTATCGFGSGNVNSCVADCVDDLLDDEPIECAVPTLNAFRCLIDALCTTPVNQRARLPERFVSCGVEIGEVAAVQPGVVAPIEFCEIDL
jgi:hypothetical protein